MSMNSITIGINIIHGVANQSNQNRKRKSIVHISFFKVMTYKIDNKLTKHP